MKTLLVAATSEELSGLYDYFNWHKKPFVQTKDTDILITGVGMTATAFALGQHLSEKYNSVLNLGIAGAFDKSIALGEVVNITEDAFSELGAEDKDAFIPIDQLGFGRSLYTSLGPHLSLKQQQLRMTRGITVNTVHGNADSITQITKRLNPQTESMEGAAVFYACTQLGLPCLQIRAISNYVEERNKDSWKIGLAIKNLNQWAIDFLTNT
jgi:futalosine hydrolase